MSLKSLFESTGFSEYFNLFEEKGIDLDTFPDLTDSHLKEIGIDKLGARIRLLRLIENLRHNAHQANLTVQGFQEGMFFGQERYELVSRLGRGGFGEVWKAKDKVASTELREVFVAVKLIPPDITRTPREIDGIKRNYALVEGLVHQHIAALKGLIQDGDDTLLLMECVEGCDLVDYRKKYIIKHGSFPESEAIRIGMQIAQALDYAHSNKVLHRDIKPENIMITNSGDVKVLDFGLAAEIQSSMNRVSMAVTDTSGTRPYMSPEAWQCKPQGQASDQYSLAVLVYEMLCAELPFVSDDTAVLRECVLKEPPEQKDGITNKSWLSLQKGLSKIASERYETCTQFLESFADMTYRVNVRPEESQINNFSYVAMQDNNKNEIAESEVEFSIESLYNDWCALQLNSRWDIARLDKIMLSANLCSKNKKSISLLVTGKLDGSSSTAFEEEVRISLNDQRIEFCKQQEFDVPFAFAVSFNNGFLTTSQVQEANADVICDYTKWLEVVMSKNSIDKFPLPGYLSNFKDRKARILPSSANPKRMLNGFLIWRYKIHKLCAEAQEKAIFPIQTQNKETIMRMENNYELSLCHQPLRNKINDVIKELDINNLTKDQITTCTNDVREFLLKEMFKTKNFSSLSKTRQIRYNEYSFVDVLLRFSLGNIEKNLKENSKLVKTLTYGEANVPTAKLRSICYYSRNSHIKRFLLEIRPSGHCYYIWIDNFGLSLALSSNETKMKEMKMKVDQFVKDWWIKYFTSLKIKLHYSVNTTGEDKPRNGGTGFTIDEDISIHLHPNYRIPDFTNLRKFFEGFEEFLSDFSRFLEGVLRF